MSNESQEPARAESRRLSTQEATNVAYSRSGYLAQEDDQFAVGDSPKEIVVNDQDPAVTTDLDRNAHKGYISCDIAADDSRGSMQVELAERDGTVYGDAFTLKFGEVYDIAGMNIAKIRLTHTGIDCGYRVNVR